MANLLLSSLTILEKYSPKFNIRGNSVGIITAGDSNVFPGIQVLYSSIKGKADFLCYDIGFTDQQKEWAIQNKLPTGIPFIPEGIKNLNKWQTYLKPWLIANSPFEYTIWIDSDCIVSGDLSLSNLIRDKKTFFVQHWLKQERLKQNSHKLYQEYPVPTPSLPYVNAGAFGINKTTHGSIIDDWKMLIAQGINNKQLLCCIVNWDEGALNWAIQKNNAGKCIIDDYRYNCFTTLHKEKTNSTYHQEIFLLQGATSCPQLVFRKILQNKAPFILHFCTRMSNKQKYWTQWQSL